MEHRTWYLFLLLLLVLYVIEHTMDEDAERPPPLVGNNPCLSCIACTVKGVHIGMTK